MITFKKYLLSEAVKSHENETIVVLHKISDMIDNGHVDYAHDRFDFNIGKLIKDKKYYNLYVCIKKGNENSTALVKNNKRDGYSIVFTTAHLPNRKTIDTFLKKEDNVKKFKAEFLKFLRRDFHKENEKSEPETSYEKSKELNNADSFEKIYNELVNLANSKLNDYKKSIEEIQKIHKDQSEEFGSKEIIGLAKKELKDNMLGNSAKAFIKNVMSAYKNKDLEFLNKEFKEKIEKRLTDFYEQKIK